LTSGSIIIIIFVNTINSNEGKRNTAESQRVGGRWKPIRNCMEEPPGASARNLMESRHGRRPPLLGESWPDRQAGWYRGIQSFVPIWDERFFYFIFYLSFWRLLQGFRL